MHGFAIVSKGFLGEPFRVSNRPRSFSPSVAIAMKGYAFYAELPAPLAELCRPITRADDQPQALPSVMARTMQTSPARAT